MRIGFLGFGNMAQAIADGLLAGQTDLGQVAKGQGRGVLGQVTQGNSDTQGSPEQRSLGPSGIATGQNPKRQWELAPTDSQNPKRQWGLGPTASQNPKRQWELAATALHLDKLERNCQARGMRTLANAADLVTWSDLVVLAVKPWQLTDLIPPLATCLQEKIVVSIAAGKTFDDLEALIPGTSHITALPNLPVAVGQGLLICEERHSLQGQQLASFEEVFGQIAEIFYLPPDQFSAGASISGCGPAFTAMYVEALADVGVKHGLKRDLALSLAAKMTSGAGSLLATGLHPALLKDQVCSPGGTTIRGVIALERHGFRAAVTEAIDTIEGQ